MFLRIAYLLLKFLCCSIIVIDGLSIPRIEDAQGMIRKVDNETGVFCSECKKNQKSVKAELNKIKKTFLLT